MRVPPNGPGGSVSFAALHAIGALMIPEPRCRHRFAALPARAGSPILVQQRGDPETASGRAAVAVGSRSARADLLQFAGVAGGDGPAHQ